MIDARTVTAMATALGMDPADTGVVTFFLPAGHPRAAEGAVAAQLGIFRTALPMAGISGTGAVGFGESPEAAFKALQQAVLGDRQAHETKTAAEATDATQKRQAVEAAVAADETAAVKP